MINPFNRPFKPVETSRDKLISILVFGLFIFLFLFLFKPFGMSDLKPGQQFFVSIGFGLVTTFVLFVFKYLLEPLIAKTVSTLGRNILWDIFIASSIGFANYLYICRIFHHPFIFNDLMLCIWTAILVGSIPVTVSYFVTYNRMYRNALREAAIPAEKILWEEEIVFRAGNQKNELKLNPKDIVYLCANDNYITIITLKEGVTGKVTIRGTLKSAEFELKQNKRFLRCHKSFIVNLDYVTSVRGHNQNMEIKLLSVGTSIPVSREKADLVLKSRKKR
jgi:hypothetical protein